MRDQGTSCYRDVLSDALQKTRAGEFSTKETSVNAIVTLFIIIFLYVHSEMTTICETESLRHHFILFFKYTMFCFLVFLHIHTICPTIIIQHSIV